MSLFGQQPASDNPAPTTERPPPPVALIVEPIGDRFMVGRRSAQAFGCVYLTRAELQEVVRRAGEVLR